MIRENICYAALFAAEALTAWLYLEYLFRRKQTTLFLTSTFVFGYIFLFIISLLDNTTVNAALFCCVNLALIELNYQCNIKTALLHTAFLCFVMVGAEILVALLISLFGYKFDAYTYNFGVMVVLVILSKLLYLMFSVVGSRIFAPHKHANEEPQFMVLFCCLPILSAIIAIITVYLGMTEGISGTVGIMTIMIIVTLLIVNLVILALYNYLQRTNDEFLTLQLSIQKEEADTTYYKALQEQYENQRILVHDIKKHLSTIGAIAEQHGAIEIERYVSSIHTALMPSTQAKLCSDPILNLILLRFREDCKERKVSFHCDVRENISEFMDASSITTLYGNLLSNSLESAGCSDEKLVELSVSRNNLQSVIVISVINSCDIAPISDGHGGFYTRKADKIVHGVGLKSINRVVRKYCGISTMYYDSTKKQFHHIIQLPLPLN